MTFLDILIRASIEGGLLILVLFLGLKAMPGIPPLVRVWLWRIVFLKLALSLLPFGAISLNVLPAPEAPIDQQTDLRVAADAGDVAPLPPAHTNRNDWAWAWLAGAGVGGIFLVRRYANARTIVESAHTVDGETIGEEVTRLSTAAGLRHTPALLSSENVPTALVVGGRRATIVLPGDKQNPEDIRLVLAHEISHIAHRDLEWNVLFSVVQVLFFFHPLVWLALHSAQQAQESAADCTAIRLAEASPKRYGEMLLRATLPSRPSLSFSGGLYLGASVRDIRKRLNELRYVNKRPTAGRFAFMIALISLVVAMTPAYQLGVQQPPSPALQPQIAMNGVAPAPAIAMAGLQPQRGRANRKHSSKRRVRTNRIRVKGKHGYRTIRVTTIAPSEAVVTSVAPVSISAPATIAVSGRAVSVSAAPAVGVGHAVSVEPPAAVGVSVSEPVTVSVAPQVGGRTDTRVVVTPTAPIAVSTRVQPLPAFHGQLAPTAIAAGGSAPMTAVSGTVQVAPAPPMRPASVSARTAPAPASSVRVTTTSEGGTTVTTVTHDVRVTTAVGVGVGHGVGRGVSTSGRAKKHRHSKRR